MSTSDSPRRRVVEWYDPTIGGRAGRGLSGMEYLEAMKLGALPAPPITRHFGFARNTLEVAPGSP